MKKLLWRIWGNICFWVGYPGIYVFVIISRPRARVLIMHQDHVLVVKSWLGSGSWTLPGGGIHPAEAALDAAIRESGEELELELKPDMLQDLGLQHSRQAGWLPTKHYLFAVQLATMPKLHIPEHEIMQVAWLPIASVNGRAHGTTASVRDALAAWSAAQNLVS